MFAKKVLSQNGFYAASIELKELTYLYSTWGTHFLYLLPTVFLVLPFWNKKTTCEKHTFQIAFCVRHGCKADRIPNVKSFMTLSTWFILANEHQILRFHWQTKHDDVSRQRQVLLFMEKTENLLLLFLLFLPELRLFALDESESASKTKNEMGKKYFFQTLPQETTKWNGFKKNNMLHAASWSASFVGSNSSSSSSL